MSKLIENIKLELIVTYQMEIISANFIDDCNIACCSGKMFLIKYHHLISNASGCL